MLFFTLYKAFYIHTFKNKLTYWLKLAIFIKNHPESGSIDSQPILR